MPTTSKNYRHYSANYYSGADIRIYFGDTWVDEVTSIDFTLQEQVAPIFGYASFTWDRVARGTRFIQGSFSINFKETAYLQMVLNSLSSDIESSSSYFKKSEYDKSMTIEALLEQKGENFYDIANSLEASFWGEGDFNETVQGHKDTTFFYPNSGATPTLNQKTLHETGFNIVVAYGGANMDGRSGNSSHETVQTIIGVQLTSVSQQVGPDGQPIQETYQFIAKDLQGDARTAG